MKENLEQKVEQSLGEQGLDEAANVRYLEPGEFVLFRGAAGGLRITLNNDRSFLRVKTRRCFPFTFPTRYISVRDSADEEIGIVKDLGTLSKDYRRWIEDDLAMRYFTPLVSSIRRIKHRWGGVEWHLETDRGRKKIITKGIHDSLLEASPGRYIITDVDGNRYELFTAKLDAASREMLNRLV